MKMLKSAVVGVDGDKIIFAGTKEEAATVNVNPLITEVGFSNCSVPKRSALRFKQMSSVTYKRLSRLKKKSL